MNFQSVRKYVLVVAAVIAVGLGFLISKERAMEAKADKETADKEKAVVEILKTRFGPVKRYEEYDTPEAPNYSDAAFWAALPSTEDTADAAPAATGFENRQSEAEADVFYVHPTTSTDKSAGWTTSAKAELKLGPFDPLALQASVFNGAARIYAPRYRQATLYSFYDESGEGKKALAFAHADVIDAFIHYLAHYNNGRPFFIAGHSQGAMMLLPVLRYLEKYPTEKFLAAYVPGWSISTNDFETMKPCNSPTELGCFNVWNAKAWGSTSEDYLAPARYIGSDCVNPLSWMNDEVAVSKEEHLGAIDILGTKVNKNFVKAKCHGEMLWVDLPADPFYQSTMNKKLYHILDYGLFYFNIRENIKQRIDAYKVK
ncbi:MAG: DUF3089 domain-containing protein [Agarilytica sp.]